CATLMTGRDCRGQRQNKFKLSPMHRNSAMTGMRHTGRRGDGAGATREACSMCVCVWVRMGGCVGVLVGLCVCVCVCVCCCGVCVCGCVGVCFCVLCVFCVFFSVSLSLSLCVCVCV